MNIVYNIFKEKILKGFNIETADLKIALIQESYTPVASHSSFTELLAYEASGSGYTSGGQALTNVSVSPSGNRQLVTANNVTWENANISARGAVVYHDSSPDFLVAYYDFGETKETLNGNFILRFNNLGFITIELSPNFVIIANYDVSIYSRERQKVKKNKDNVLDRLLSSIKTKVILYFGKKTEGVSFCEEEQNHEEKMVGQMAIPAVVRQLTPTSLHFRKYGLQLSGAVEVITDSKYKNKFLIADKITINKNEYEVFSNNMGAYSSLRDLPLGRIAITLKKISGSNPVTKRNIFK